MKKLIAMILAMALCLGGCADTVQPQLTEDPTTTAEQTTATPETTEAEETTEEITTKAEKTTEAQLDAEPTQVEMLLKLLEENHEPTGDTQIEAQGYLRPFEMALYVLMQDCRRLFDDVYEEVNYFEQKYYEQKYNQHLFAWQLAQCDPTIEVKYAEAEDSDYTAGKISMPKEEFENYYMSLFGENAVTSQLCLYDAFNGYFQMENDELCLNYYSDAQNAFPVLKNPKLYYNSETDDYCLSVDMLAQQQYQYINGHFQYTFKGEYLNYADPAVTEYPEEYLFAKIIFRLNKTENGYRFKSLEFEDINRNTYTLMDNQNSFVGKPLTELLDLAPYDRQMSEDLRIGMQAALCYEYQPMICWLALSDDWEVELKKNHNYLSSPEEKTLFVWYQMTSGELRHPRIVRFEGNENATGVAVVTVEDFNQCCRRLLGEKVDIERLNEIKRLTVSEKGTMCGTPFAEAAVPALKNPIFSYDAVTNNYLLTMELVNQSEYVDYNIINYPSESVIGTIIFRMIKTDNGYQFKSIVISD